MLARSGSSTTKQNRLAQTDSTFCRIRLAMRAWSTDGVKDSIATTLHHSGGGQFIAHAKAPPDNPYDGRTLEAVIPEIEAQIGASLSRIVADRGYLGAMRSIVATATTRRPTIASRSISQARRGASPTRSNASCAAAPRSSRSSATTKASIGWAAIVPSPEGGDSGLPKSAAS